MSGAVIPGLILCLALQDGAVQHTFEGERPGLEPALTGRGKPAAWKVVRDTSAPSGTQVLESVDPDPTDYRFPLAVDTTVHARDGLLWVRFKPVRGKMDRSGGLVWRYRDAENYYVARANALENDLRFYKVVGGHRIQLAAEEVRIPSNRWHTLAVRFHGNRHSVVLDGEAWIEMQDDAFPDAGCVGIWTKSDSLTRFDDLTFVPFGLRPAPASHTRIWDALVSLADPGVPYHSARRLASRALREVPEGSASWCVLKAVSAGNLEEARRAAEGLDVNHPARLLALMDRPSRILERVKDDDGLGPALVAAAMNLRLRNREAARKICDRILLRRPHCLQAIMIRARAHPRKRRRAWLDAGLALTLVPRSVEALILAAKLRAASDPKGAHRLLDRAGAIRPDGTDVLLARSWVYFVEGRYREMRKILDHAIEIDPEEPRAWYNRSLAWERLGNHDRSMKDAQRAAELAPELPHPHHQMGRLYGERYALDRAEKEFAAAVRIDPAYAKSHIGLGWVCARRGEFEEAIRHYDEAIRFDDSITEAWGLRGNAWWKLHRLDQCIRDYSRAIELDPSKGVLYANRAWAYMAGKMFVRALEDFRRAIRLDPRLKAVVEDDMARARREIRKREY